jgi:hypothetical protein
MLLNRIFTRLAVVGGLLVVGLAGCSDDAATSTACTFDTDCALGTVCSVDKLCVKAACDFCTADQVCLTTDEGSFCSAPECSSAADCVEKGGVCKAGLCTDQQCVTSADCGPAQICNLASQCVDGDGTCASAVDCPSGQICKDSACVPGCETHEQCEEGKACNSDGVCVSGCRDVSECGTGQACDDGRCVCTPGSCGDGKSCDVATGSCVEVTSCGQVTCTEDSVCDPITLECVAKCTPESCQAGQVCNSATGACEQSNCPGEDPAQCEGNAQRPTWDPVKCFCAACLTNDDCTGAGEVCTASGSCFACQTACDSGTPGSCGGDTPYCINDCCVQCVGAADCPQGQLCLEGACGVPPSCATDPTICPAGTTCQNGNCSANSGGGACDPTNPTGCPAGTFCDPTTLTCSGGIGGGLGCGLCNPDCTCDGGLSCNGFLCEGCGVEVFGVPVGGPACPGSQTCLPLEALGIGNICFGG